MEKQAKRVLVLSAVARKGGNTDRISEEFIKGAEAEGHTIEKVYVHAMTIKGCIGCRACQSNGGRCVLRDDMATVYDKMKEADVIVWVTPVYFYSFNSQLKAVMDRTFAIEHVIKDKTAYLIASGAAPKIEYMALLTDHFRKYLSCFNHITEGGIVIGCGTTNKGDIDGSPALQEAFEMGKNI